MNTTDHSRRPSNQEIGARGEALAAQYLADRGFIILRRNWRCRQGELDIIADDEGCIVAVEVKTRTSHGYGTPLEAITAAKAARLKRLLLDWCRESRVSSHAGLRIDAIGITLSTVPNLDHLKGIS